MAATNKRGVFSLETVLERQDSNNWTNILDPFIYVTSINPEQVAGPAHGYFAAGYNSGGYYYMSITQRLDYDNDTSQTVTKGNLPLEINECHGGTGNTSYGYTFGGRGPSPSNNRLSSTFRVEYANDTALASEKGSLSSGRRINSSVGNANYGYAGGGYDINYSAMDKLDYSNDTTATTNSDGLTPGRYSYACTGNQSYGYFIGGYGDPASPGAKTIVSRLDYSNDSAATSPKGPLPNSAYTNSGTGNANYGYVDRGGGDNYSSRIYRIDYANDTSTAVQKGPLNYEAQTRVATGNGTTGYFAGGFSPSGTGLANNSGIDYSNDTATASPKGALVIGCSYGFNFSPREYGLPQTSSARSVNPATQYEPPLPSPISAGPAYGYSGGGGAGTFGTRETGGSKVQRINFASDTSTTSVRGNLAHDHLHGGAVGNATHGYVMGDLFTTTPRSWVSRVTYASDSSTASPRGSLTVARGGGSSTGNASYAWFSGAWDWIYHTAGPNASVVDRIDFANDNVTASARGNLDRAVGKVSSSGNANYGWWYGGLGQTAVSRVDYGNDTATASPKGTMSANVNENTAVGNINYGYTTRGNNSYTDFLRYDYANDTGASTPKGSLSFARNDFAGATGSQSYGYFMGGTTYPTYYTSIDRIEYANDTATASPKGNLSLMIAGSTGYRRAGGFSGQSNAFGGTPTAPSTTKLVDKGSDGYLTSTPYSYGPAHSYVVGGWRYGNANATSNVTRLNWSNNNISSAPNLPNTVEKTVGANSKDYGYISSTYPASTHAWRIDFSTDGSTYLPGVMVTSGTERGAVSNINYGYWAGGSVPAVGVVSTIDRLDFANDTSGAVIKGPLAVQVYQTAGSGNKNFGFFGGGRTNMPSSYGNINKLNYANDTVTRPNSFAGTSVPSATGTGNANYGYFKDGNWYEPTKSTVYRLDYSNDNLGGSSRLNLYYAVGEAAGASSESQGAFCYGFTVGRSSPGYSNATSFHYYAQIFDYANDTSMNGQFTPAAYHAFAGATGARHNDVSTGGPVYIPRVRFIDSKAEEQATSPSPNPAYSNPSMAYTIGGRGQPGNPATEYANPAQRIDMSNDTATAVAKAGAAPPTDRLYYCSSVGNRDYAWTTMGATYSNVQRLDYANDSAQMVNRCNRQPGVQLGYNERATGNNDYGYFSGGNINYTIPGCGYYAPSLSKVNRMTYASDTTNTVFRCNTSYGSGGRSACGNSSYGWWIGGSYTYCNNYSSTYVERLDYSNDTGGTSNRGPLTNPMNYGGAQGNANYGWALAVGPSNSHTTVNRITYANDTTTATPKGNLSAATGYQATTGSQSFGYSCGGNPQPGTTKVDRIDYANDTSTATPKGPLVWRLQSGGGASASENDIAVTPSPATDIPGDPGFLAPYQPPFPFPVQSLNPFNFGYFLGGSTSIGSMSNPQSTGVQYSRIQRIDYTNDTATAMIRGRVQVGGYATQEISGTSSAIHGYVAGFAPSNYYTQEAQRIDYANDTADGSPRTNVLASPKSDCAAVGNKNFGYWAGGAGPGSPYGKSDISRLDFSNDTGGGTPKGNISQGRYALSGISNQSYGYIVGGYQSDTSPNRSTKVERLDFSNDTGTTLKGPLASERNQACGGIGNANYGYSVGGQITGSPSDPPAVTTVERIDFANDTATAAPKGPLSQSRWGLEGTGDQSYGYVAGGQQSYSDHYSQVTTIDRIDFSNDTATASPKGNLEMKVRDHGSVSAAAAANSP